MTIFYSTEIHNNYIYLRKDEHIHCTKVLRNQSGSEIKVTDGKGHLYACTIDAIHKTETSCKIDSIEEKPQSKSLSSIAISPLKNPARIEWFVEKAVEIGVSELIIFTAARTEKKYVNKERLEKIMVSAMKQSMNFNLPTLTFVNSFSDLIIKCQIYEGKYIAWCEGEADLLINTRDIQKNNIVIIGPEGDFINDEVTLAINEGFRVVSLGHARLRTETAGIVALTMLNY